MATDNKSARSLDLLDKDIRRLQAKAKKLEDEIDNNFTYLQRHSAALFINSLFPRKIRAEETAREGLLGVFLENERLMNTLNKLATRLVNRATEFINKLIDKWIG
jgi:cell division septum initiation protein DivIVA